MKSHLRLAVSLLTALVCLTAAGLGQPASAQSDAEAISRGFSYPNPSVTTVDDLTSVEINPAGLGLVEGGEFAYGLGLKTPRPGDSLASEHTVMGAGGTGSFGAGFALQWLQGEFGGRSVRYHKHSLGIGFKPGSIMSLGTAVHFFGSPESRALDRMTSWDVGMQFRPTSFLGFALGARNINQPFASAFESIPLSLHPGLALRFFDGRLILDGGLSWTPRDGDTVVRPRINVEPLRGLQVFARAGMPFDGAGDTIDRTSLSAGLAVNLGHAGVRSGVGVQEVAGDEPRVARQSHLIRATSQRKSSIVPYGDRWVRITIDDTLAEQSEHPLFGPERRGLLELQRTFAEMRDDPEINGVLLDIRPNDLGYAQMWELRQSLHRLRDAGKQVVALLQAPDTPNAYLAAAADVTWLLPSEPYEPSGLSTRRTHYATLLRNIGVRAEFIRIGDYKSAPESFIRQTPSEASLEQTNAYLDAIFSTVVSGLGDDLEASNEAIRDMIDSVPHLPATAIDEGYVDDVVYPDEVHGTLQKTFGPIASIDDAYITESTGSEHWGSPLEVAIVYIDGSIVRGRSGRAPLIGERVSGHETIRDIVNRLLSAPDVRAAVIRIDSPGGSAVASDLMYREIRRLATEMPVVASMGDVAASGGYYVASAAEEIFATPNTLTGSIGIFAGKFSISNLADWIGVNSRELKRGETAGMYSIYEPWTDAETNAVAKSMNYLYQLFLEQAARTRPLDAEEIDKLARGRVWAGSTAADNKLVDEVGSLMDAIRRAEELAGLEPGRTRYQTYPTGTDLPTFTSGLLASVRQALHGNKDRTTAESAAEKLLERLGTAAALPLLYGQKEPLMLPYTPIRLQ